MRLFVFARHGESVLNIERRINGDPSVDVPLTEEGRSQAHKLGVEVANIGFDLCFHTRFSRTRETAEIALAGRHVPLVEEPLLDDIDVPGGESLDDAALRYAQAFRRLLKLPHDTVLVVTHEIPIRYALNGAGGSDSLDGPAHEVENAVAYLFDDESLARAADGIEAIVAG